MDTHTPPHPDPTPGHRTLAPARAYFCRARDGGAATGPERGCCATVAIELALMEASQTIGAIRGRQAISRIPAAQNALTSDKGGPGLRFHCDAAAPPMARPRPARSAPPLCRPKKLHLGSIGTTPLRPIGPHRSASRVASRPLAANPSRTCPAGTSAPSA